MLERKSATLIRMTRANEIKIAGIFLIYTQVLLFRERLSKIMFLNRQDVDFVPCPMRTPRVERRY